MNGTIIESAVFKSIIPSRTCRIKGKCEKAPGFCFPCERNPDHVSHVKKPLGFVLHAKKPCTSVLGNMMYLGMIISFLPLSLLLFLLFSDLRTLSPLFIFFSQKNPKRTRSKKTKKHLVFCLSHSHSFVLSSPSLRSKKLN